MTIQRHQLVIGGLIAAFVLIVMSLFFILRSESDTPSIVPPPIEHEPAEGSVPTELEEETFEPEEDLYPDDADRDGIPDETEQEMGLDPFAYDTDTDGLSDAYELEIGTDPLRPDTDDDGLTDGQEVLIFDTDPRNPDTDGDGYLDGVEVEAGYSPLCAGNVLLFEPCDA